MAFRWYRTKLQTAPLATQCITTGILFATGDVLAQQAVEKRGVDKHDFSRTGRMAGYGGVIFAPAATKWYSFLTRHINFPSQNATVIARVAADQLAFAPVNMALFLSTMAYLEGTSIRRRLHDAYVPGLTKNFLIWPWVQFTNFKYVPMEYRILVVNVVSLGWNCYLSALNAGGKKEGEDGAKGREGGELPPS